MKNPSIRLTLMKASTAKRSYSRSSSPLGALTVSLFLLVLLAVFVSPWMIQGSVQSRLSKATGLSVNIGSAHFKLTQPNFWIKDMQLLNPKGFPAAPLAQIEEATGQYSRASFLLGQPRFKKIRITFKEFRLMRNEKGELNLPKLTAPVSSNTVIGELELNLNTVTYTDLSSGQPVQQTFNLGLTNSIFRNVKGIPGIIEILGWEILKRTGVPEKVTLPVPGVKPIAELRAVFQTGSVPAPSIAPVKDQSQPAPSLAPSAPEAAAPSSKTA